MGSYRGTMTYMAPEIKEGKQYKGTQVDMFSIGVILFIIVQGIFPFKEARKEEYFYNLLLQGKIDTYFTKVNGTGLSDDFKDLILRFFSYDGNLRPTIEQVNKSENYIPLQNQLKSNIIRHTRSLDKDSQKKPLVATKLENIPNITIRLNEFDFT